MKTTIGIVGCAVMIFAAMQTACWRTVVIADSPDRQHRTRIREWCIPPDCGIKVQVESLLWPHNIGQIKDAELLFAHAAWSSDSRAVGVLVVNGYGTGIRTGYDTVARRQLPFSMVDGLVGESIKIAYGLSSSDLTPYNGDSIRWVEASDTARNRFTALYRR